MKQLQLELHLVEDFGPPKVVSQWLFINPCEKYNAWQVDTRRNVVGSIPGCRQKKFTCKLLVKLNLFKSLVAEFVHYKILSSIVWLIVLCVHVAIAPRNSKNHNNKWNP